MEDVCDREFRFDKGSCGAESLVKGDGCGVDETRLGGVTSGLMGGFKTFEKGLMFI